MRVIIFHGWGSTPDDNWFPWLKRSLETEGHEVHCPILPDPSFPKQEVWLREAGKLLYDGETVLVGHSLGSVLIMRLLERVRVKAAFLVAGFDRDLGISQLKDFFIRPFPYETIRKNAKIFMLSSDNDPYISLDISKELAGKIGCPLRVFKGAEHLSNGTGDFEFPELLAMIDELH